MIKSLLLFVCIACTALGSSAAARWWMSNRQAGAQIDETHKLVHKKTRPITVPMVAGGQVNGYVIAQFGYAASEEGLKKLPVAPEPFILDEGFRLIYEDERRDFHNFRKADLTSLTKELRERIGKRLKSDAIEDIVIEDFNYVARQDVLK